MPSITGIISWNESINLKVDNTRQNVSAIPEALHLLKITLWPHGDVISLYRFTNHRTYFSSIKLYFKKFKKKKKTILLRKFSQIAGLKSFYWMQLPCHEISFFRKISFPNLPRICKNPKFSPDKVAFSPWYFFEKKKKNPVVFQFSVSQEWCLRGTQCFTTYTPGM